MARRRGHVAANPATCPCRPRRSGPRPRRRRTLTAPTRTLSARVAPSSGAGAWAPPGPVGGGGEGPLPTAYCPLPTAYWDGGRRGRCRGHRAETAGQAAAPPAGVTRFPGRLVGALEVLRRRRSR